MAKVSIIIPIYNVEKYLRKCLDSIINQTLKDIEIICVDDESPDLSLEILKEYASKDNRIKIISQKNTGLGGARDAGLRAANGEYVGFIDADDWIDLDYFEKLYTAAKDKNADIARTSYTYEYQDGVSKKEEQMGDIIQKRLANNENLQINDHSVVCCNAIYRREFLNKNKIDFQNVKQYEDVVFTAKATFLANCSVPVEGYGYHYLKTRSGVLSDFSIKSIPNMIKTNNLVISFINSIDCTEEDYLIAFHRCIWRIDNAFQRALNFKWFNKKLQKECFEAFCKMYKNCKYLEDYKNARSEVYLKYLEKEDFKSYSKLYSKNICSTILGNIFSVKNEGAHKKLTIFGIKFKFRK